MLHLIVTLGSLLSATTGFTNIYLLVTVISQHIVLVTQLLRALAYSVEITYFIISILATIGFFNKKRTH